MVPATQGQDPTVTLDSLRARVVRRTASILPSGPSGPLPLSDMSYPVWKEPPHFPGVLGEQDNGNEVTLADD